MPRAAITIGDLVFKTKKAAKDYFKEMLGRYRNGQTIEEIDASQINDLIERHPEAERKIGCGIARFFKHRTDKFTSCFWLERTDGSRTDFSYLSCVDAKGTSLYQEFSEACREAVKDDLKAMKRRHFELHGDEHHRIACDITGQKLAIYESHLDHKKPMTFQVIVRTFIAAHNIEIRREMLSTPKDAQFVATFTDLAVGEQFRAYHHRVCDLRIISVERNLSLGGSERITKSHNPVMVSLENHEEQ